MRDIDGQRLRPGDTVRLVGPKVPAKLRCQVCRVRGPVVIRGSFVECATIRANLRDAGILDAVELVDLETIGWMIAAQCQKVVRVEHVPATKTFNELMDALNA